MAGTNLSILDAVLKEFYGPKIVEQLQNDTPALQYFKAKTTPFTGRRFIVPIHTGRNEGMGFRKEGDTLPSAGSQKYTDVIVSPTYFYGKYMITGPSIEQTANDAGAFARAQTLEVKGLVTDMAKRLNQQFYLNQAGVRGTVASVGGSTITLTGPSKGLEVGMVVDVYSSDLLTKRNSTDLTISAVTDAGLNDTSITAFTFTGTASGIAANDVVVMKGNVSAGAGIGVIGLADAIASSGTYLTVNPATYPLWVSSVLSNGGTLRSISEDLIQQLKDRIRQKSGRTIGAYITTYNIRRRFFNSLAPNRRFVNTKKIVAGGAEVVDFDGTDIMVDPDCPNYTMFGLTPDTWHIAQTRDGHWVDDDGTVLHRDLADTDSYYATWRWFFQLYCDQRNANGKITDLSE